MLAIENNVKRFLKFAVVGGFGTVVNIVVFTGLNLIGFHHILSAIFSFCVAVVFNYIFNLLWVFCDRTGKKSSTISILKFIFVSVFSLIINLIVLYFCQKYINYDFLNIITVFILKVFNISDASVITKLYSQCIAIGTAMIFNFIGNNIFTFKPMDK